MFNPFKKKVRTFYVDDEEKYCRCWWLANKVTIKALEIFSPMAISSWINDIRFQEHDRKCFAEIIGYIMSFTMNRLRDDIEATHGWSDSEWKLDTKYQVCLGKAFDKVFGIKDNSEESFCVLLDDYYNPEYEDDYEKFWGITYDDYPELEDSDDSDGDVPKIENLEQGLRIMDEIKKKQEENEKREEEWYSSKFNIEKYYIYRMSKKVSIADAQKVIDNVRVYSDIGNSYYDDAFFDLGLNSIKRQLKQMLNR